MIVGLVVSLLVGPSVAMAMGLPLPIATIPAAVSGAVDDADGFFSGAVTDLKVLIFATGVAFWIAYKVMSRR